jgi:hypothetical protein
MSREYTPKENHMENSDRYFIGAKSHALKTDEQKCKLRERIRQLLNVRHVNLFVGNGASLALGAPSISNIHDPRLREFLDDDEETISSIIDEPELDADEPELDADEPELDADEPELDVESFLGLLSHIIAVNKITNGKTNSYSEVSIEKIIDLQNCIKKWLFRECSNFVNKLDSDKLKTHSELIKRFLLRPVSLPRLKIFTINYDLVLEKTLDHLGVSYFDGFIGTVERTMRPESYHYDLYFPGETTEGRVSRVDRVVQLYKLHGSVNWKRKESGNLYEVVQGPFLEDKDYEDLLIYPSPIKYDEMHGYPYSEMFRHFSTAINRPQSVLFTIGYKFGDNHINRIIYQALSIPSFTLVIILPEYDKNSEITRLVENVHSDRILFITGGEWDDIEKHFKGGAGTLQGFVDKYLPDMEELDLQAKIKEEMDRLCNKDEDKEKNNEQ